MTECALLHDGDITSIIMEKTQTTCQPMAEERGLLARLLDKVRGGNE